MQRRQLKPSNLILYAFNQLQLITSRVLQLPFQYLGEITCYLPSLFRSFLYLLLLNLFGSVYYYHDISPLTMANLNPFAAVPKSDLSFATKKSPVPGSRSFTFSISEFWKPTKEPFRQWIKDLPDPMEYYDKPVEPARYHTLKHSIVRTP